MKLKYLLCILLLPLTLLGVNTNQVDNLWIPAAGSARFSNGSPGAGKTFTSDASGFGTWTTPIYGNVFTSSNNTFIAGKTNTFSGVVIIDGVRYPIADGTTNQVMTFGGNGTLYASGITTTDAVANARYVIKAGFSSGSQSVDGLFTVSNNFAGILTNTLNIIAPNAIIGNFSGSGHLYSSADGTGYYLDLANERFVKNNIITLNWGASLWNDDAGVLAGNFNTRTLAGNWIATNNFSVNGNTTIGDNIADTVTMNAATMAIPNDWSVGSGAFFISNSTGNVGIGTIAPSQRLHISSSSTTGTGLTIANTDTGGASYRIISTGSANTGGAGKLTIYNETSGIFSLAIDTNGSVGIKTNSPAASLHVNGNSIFGGTIYAATNIAPFVVNNNVPAALNTFYTNGNLRSDVMVMVNMGATIGGQAFVELWTGSTIAACTNVQSSFVIGAGLALSERFTFNAMVAPNELMLITNLSSGGGTATFIQGRLRN